jgi:SMI1 / KNR4 family (SUKH-1)
MKYLNKVISKFISRNAILMPCTDEEVEKVKLLVDGNLPDCYIEFLKTMGKEVIQNENRPDYFDYGSFTGNSVYYYKGIEQNNGKDGLRGLLEDDESKLTVPNKAFVFYGSQGILYAFFKIDEGDNPPVYGYAEGFEGEEFPKIADTLSQFYEDYLEHKNVFSKLF